MPGPTSYTCDVAVPPPSDEEVRKVLGDAYDPGQTLNVVKMLAGTQDMCEPTLGLVRSVFTAEGVDPKLRQAIILRAATVLNAPYEWQANVPMSRNNGLSDEEIAHIGASGPVQGVADAFQLVCTATDEMCGSGTLNDATLRRLLAAHGEIITRKLVLIIAWFNMLSLFLNGCRVPMETTDKIGAKTSPLKE